MDTLAELPARVQDLLCSLVAALDHAGCNYALIGATAILLHGVDLLRVTRDLDFVIAVADGIAAVPRLLSEAGLEETSVWHKYRAVDEIKVDVIPLGSDEAESNVVSLPGGRMFSSIGLDDALRCSVRIEIDGCSVSTASIPILVALKLVAATERHREDLADVCACLAGYRHKDERRYVVHFEASSFLTYETAGAYLAGLDLADSASDRTVGAALATAKRMKEQESALLRAVRSLGVADAEPRELLDAFEKGALAGRS